MDAREIDMKGVKALAKAVFNQAIKDYVKITAHGDSRIKDIGNKREIERYLDTNLASWGTDMNTSEVKKKLKAMSQLDAIRYLRTLRKNGKVKEAAI